MEQDQIIKGFNSGYFLAKNHPALFDKLQSEIKDKDHPYAKGFLSGSLEYKYEKSQSKDQDFKSRVEAWRDNKKEKDQDLDRGR